MSMDRWEYEQEAALDRLYNEYGPEWVSEHRQELYEEAVGDFTSERLRSYYLAHPNLAEPAHNSLNDALALLKTHPKAALVLAATAVELGIKALPLHPIVFGLVHNEALAELITELTTQHTGMERFQDLLGEILKNYGGVDLKSFARRDSKRTLWQEIGEIQKVRNRVIHRGVLPDTSSAELSIAVAETILNQLFPEVLEKLDLHLHKPWTVCGNRHPGECVE